MSDSTIPWMNSPKSFDNLWKKEATEVPDMLATMYAQQQAHMRAYADLASPDYSPMSQLGGSGRVPSITSPKDQAAIREAAGYVVEELYEAINLLKNKPWKQDLKSVNRDDFLEELADMWHFLLELHILAGVYPTDIFQAYFAKTLINKTRRETGY